ncbi:MAG: response regulator, partial [Desulfobacterales bacterium]|nr:response regulator [Desulfobacterales bacterium]
MNADNVSILVADDDRSNRTLICRLLEKKQFTTRVVENGVEALEALRNKAFDIILMDIMMPQMNGYQVLAKLKADVDL